MIPNAGLDNIAAYPAWFVTSGSTAAGSGLDWLAFAAISEDSSAPDPSDTNIGSEAMRTNATGGFSRTATAIRDSGADLLGVSIERAYVFPISTSLNITKYGYVPLSVGGNFSWIDLTRDDPDDPMSTPVVLTLVDGDELQLWQTLTITVPWSVDLEQFVITGTDGNDTAGTHDAYCGFYAVNADTTGTHSVIATIGTIFWPSVNTQHRIVATPQTPSLDRDTPVTSTATGQALGSAPTLAAYTGGNYYRDKLFTFTTAQANMSITGVAITVAIPDPPVTAQHGFKVVFDDPALFVKDNLHALTLTFRVSWAEG